MKIYYFRYKKFLFSGIFYILILTSSYANQINIGSDEGPEHRLTLSFSEIKVRDSLQFLSEFSGYNLIVDDNVRGQLTLHLSNIPWRQALDIILKTHGLDKRVIPHGWYITTKNEFLRQDKINFEIRTQMQALAPLIVRVFRVRYGRASDLSVLLQDKNNFLLSSRGKIAVDDRSNSLWIQDTEDQFKKIEQVMQHFDTPTKQVAIEARIVSIDQDRKKELGVSFGLRSIPISHSDESHGIKRSDIHAVLPLTMDLPFPAESTAKVAGLSLGLQIMRLRKNALLDLELAALESEGGARVIAAPHLLTADRQTAYIETGEEIPYQGRTAEGSGTVVFKKAVLALRVTPRVLSEHKLILDLTVNQDQPSNFSVLNVPAIRARGIKTQLMLENGETVVLGGIYEHAHRQAMSGIPFLDTLPIIGNLFRYKASSDMRNELLIFVTPTILPS